MRVAAEQRNNRLFFPEARGQHLNPHIHQAAEKEMRATGFRVASGPLPHRRFKAQTRQGERNPPAGQQR